jgi:hypothetical protein
MRRGASARASRPLLSDACDLLVDMRVALTADRPRFWARTANALKGTSGNIGAAKMAARAAEAEADQPSPEWLGWLEASFREIRWFVESQPVRRPVPRKGLVERNGGRIDAGQGPSGVVINIDPWDGRKQRR